MTEHADTDGLGISVLLTELALQLYDRPIFTTYNRTEESLLAPEVPDTLENKINPIYRWSQALVESKESR